PPENALKIELYARQFDWTARYAGADNALGDFNYRLIGGMNALGLKKDDEKVKDDVLVKGEFHLIKDRSVEFAFRAQEVIHSAYMPHFRAQMNCVPGMTTRFNFIPNKTTAEMREITGDPEFDFILICNKICGMAHYNMQMKIVVDTQEEYDVWIAEQKTVEASGIFADLESDKKSLPEDKLLASGK
ncbi:MAG: cytochrome c oxidase subunit II, partial [Flavobacteriales bacterium]|nr:cytochrome c oxidase subunit II [Flavobacteriales bacterium]